MTFVWYIVYFYTISTNMTSENAKHSQFHKIQFKLAKNVIINP